MPILNPKNCDIWPKNFWPNSSTHKIGFFLEKWQGFIEPFCMRQGPTGDFCVQNFNFWPKYRFLPNISIFDQNIDSCQTFQFFYQNIDSCQTFQFFYQNFNFIYLFLIKKFRAKFIILDCSNLFCTKYDIRYWNDQSGLVALNQNEIKFIFSSLCTMYTILYTLPLYIFSFLHYIVFFLLFFLPNDHGKVWWLFFPSAQFNLAEYLLKYRGSAY